MYISSTEKELLIIADKEWLSFFVCLAFRSEYIHTNQKKTSENFPSLNHDLSFYSIQNTLLILLLKIPMFGVLSIYNFDIQLKFLNPANSLWILFFHVNIYCVSRRFYVCRNTGGAFTVRHPCWRRHRPGGRW